MYLTPIIKNADAQKVLRNALSQLNSIGMFGAMMELEKNRNVAAPSTESIATNALRASWHDGYMAAIDDLYYFFDKYIPTAATNKPSPDFGAAKTLLDQGEITKEEYERLTGSKV